MNKKIFYIGGCMNMKKKGERHESYKIWIKKNYIFIEGNIC